MQTSCVGRALRLHVACDISSITPLLKPQPPTTFTLPQGKTDETRILYSTAIACLAFGLKQYNEMARPLGLKYVIAWYRHIIIVVFFLCLFVLLSLLSLL